VLPSRDLDAADSRALRWAVRSVAHADRELKSAVDTINTSLQWGRDCRRRDKMNPLPPG
jgi:hypothetical protein